MSMLGRIANRNVLRTLALGSVFLCGLAIADELGPVSTRTASPVISLADPTHSKQRIFSFRPSTFDDCKYFLITETSTDRVLMKTDDAFDQYIFTNRLGLMKNLDKHRAIGGSLDLRLAMGVVSCAPTLRYRQWLTHDRSLDLSASYVANQARGLVGPILDARINLTNYFYVQGGVCQFRDEWYGWDIRYPSAYDQLPRHRKVYGGVGFGGRPGAMLWGVELVGIGLLAILFSGMS
jgi:hypothetical protein